MVRALDCHSRGRGFEPRRSRVGQLNSGHHYEFSYYRILIVAEWLEGVRQALVVKLVDTPS